MSVTVVVGGQYGSEGKGKVCAHLALTRNPAYMCAPEDPTPATPSTKPGCGTSSGRCPQGSSIPRPGSS